MISMEASEGVPDLRAKYQQLTEDMLKLNSQIGDKLAELEAKEKSWSDLMAKVASQVKLRDEVVKLNIGGTVFMSSKSTLLQGSQEEPTYFHALLGSGKWEPCGDGAYFIDRDPKLFERIMAALRDDEPVDYDGLQPSARKRLMREADYYQVHQMPCAWDAERVGQHCTLSEGNRTVTKTGGGTGWNAGVVGSCEVSKWKVRLLSNPCVGNILVGCIKSSNLDGTGDSHNGGSALLCYVSCFGGVSGIEMGLLPRGTVIEVEPNRSASRVTFKVQRPGAQIETRVCSGLSFDAGPLLPCVRLASEGSSVRLESSEQLK